MTIPTSTDVLIVGAGPTGLALAVSLGQAGVDHVLIDRLAEGQNTSRAAVIHAQTLEALDGLGVSGALTQLGLKLDAFSIRDRDRILVHLTFHDLPSPFPYLLMVPQDVTERVLADRHRALGGGVLRGVTAERFEQGADGVRAEVTGPDGARSVITARYVVGADGMHSAVRESAGIAFEGSGDPHSFVLADVAMDWPEARKEVQLFFAPDGPVVVSPLPNGHFRVVAGMEQAPERPDVADIQFVLDAHGPSAGAPRITAVSWSSRFRIHHRLAATYRQGRLLVMGDAAHVHSPAGGQGMNTGLVDATVLGQLLADVVHGTRPDVALDLYERLRRPAAQKVLRLAGGLTEMAMMKTPLDRTLRDLRLIALDHVPLAKKQLINNLSGISRRAATRVPA